MASAVFYSVTIEAWHLDTDHNYFASTVEHYANLEQANASARQCALFGGYKSNFVPSAGAIMDREYFTSKLYSDEEYTFVHNAKVTKARVLTSGIPLEAGSRNPFRPRRVIGIVRKVELLDLSKPMTPNIARNWDRFMPDSIPKASILKTQGMGTAFPTEFTTISSAELRPPKRRIVDTCFPNAVSGPPTFLHMASSHSATVERSCSVHTSSSTLSWNASDTAYDPVSLDQSDDFSPQKIKSAFQTVIQNASSAVYLLTCQQTAIEKLCAKEQDLKQKETSLEERKKLVKQREQKYLAHIQARKEQSDKDMLARKEKFDKESQSLTTGWQDLENEKESCRLLKEKLSGLAKEKEDFEMVKREYRKRHESLAEAVAERESRLVWEKAEFESAKDEFEKEKLQMQRQREEMLEKVQSEMQQQMKATMMKFMGGS
ncbi:hypothetical protein BJ508DRAFT_376604 [Ascobolus immersus RN42]|uniref:Uncharacterized protein n=1 Tax=Ascobolus immersus RN42 TaxID=1160509 RepID=A0A3N4I740_ASCIM|nr:hypothetical protein BJ508DRAFT_376604 [Ascobolus immersus RN42]